MRRLLLAASPWLSSLLVHATVLTALGLLFVAVDRAKPGLWLDMMWSDATGEADCSVAAVTIPQSVDRHPWIESIEIDPFDVPEPPKLFLISGARANDDRSGTSGGGAVSPRRTGGKVEFYGTVTRAERVVFVLDISGSMGEQERIPGKPARFRQAAAELVTAIDRLYDNQRFYVVLFNDMTRPMFDQSEQQAALIRASDRNKDQLASWLAGIQPHGWTDPRGSLRLALSLDPDAIFLLSDGEFRIRSGSSQGGSTLKLLRKINLGKTPIHTVAFQDKRSRRTLQAVAKESGGTYRFVP